MRIVVAMVVAVVLGGWTGATATQDKKNGQDETRDPLPYAGTIAWDVKALEQEPDHFLVVKRKVSKEAVVWLLELKSDRAVQRVRSYQPNYLPSHYLARFLDEDGVAVASVALIPDTTDVLLGERVRYTLKMPSEEVIQKTNKVVFKYGSN